VGDPDLGAVRAQLQAHPGVADAGADPDERPRATYKLVNVFYTLSPVWPVGGENLLRRDTRSRLCCCCPGGAAALEGCAVVAEPASGRRRRSGDRGRPSEGPGGSAVRRVTVAASVR